MTPAEEKAVLRQRLRTEASEHSVEQHRAASQQLCQRLRQQEVWKQAAAVLFYMPLANEPDVTELIGEALAEGKTAALLRYTEHGGRYVACQIKDLNADTCPGAFGIVEPIAGCPLVELNALDLLLVPGVGFSFNGRRLGRGKGHYDRLLAKTSGVKCGVAFDWQLVGRGVPTGPALQAVEIPIERHDILLDCIVTPTRWHIVAGFSGG